MTVLVSYINVLDEGLGLFAEYINGLDDGLGFFSKYILTV